MSVFAILMFITLGFALGFGVFQVIKTKKELPKDTSRLQPERSLQKMDQADPNRSVRGTKKDPRKA